MNRFMEIAIREAREGMDQNEGGPFGAVVIRDDSVISAAHNEVLKTNDPSAHAEILAIRRASAILERFDLSDCEIYTTSQPCPMCLSAICWARIKKIYYGTTTTNVTEIGFDDDRIYRMLRGDTENLPINCENIDSDQCEPLLQEWKLKPDRTMY
ncbi:MAG: nucleoside deaminase [Methanosarcinaceae archaeon]|nr:nucleoside deaminase [Methanosarcinaceae archaeon]